MKCDVRVAGPARQIVVGELSSRGLLPFTGPQCLNGAGLNKKTAAPHCPLYFEAQLPGSGAMSSPYAVMALLSNGGISPRRLAGG